MLSFLLSAIFVSYFIGGFNSNVQIQKTHLRGHLLLIVLHAMTLRKGYTLESFNPEQSVYEKKVIKLNEESTLRNELGMAV